MRSIVGFSQAAHFIGLLFALTLACATAPSKSSPAAGRQSDVFTTRSIAQEPLVGGVSVRVYVAATDSGLHEALCWTYVTEGLAKYQHPEFAVSVKREPREAERAFPRDILELLASLSNSVRDGHRLTAWQSLGFPSGLLGRKDFTGVLTVPVLVPPGIDVASSALSLLIVTSGELEVARTFGVPRISSLLGLHHRFFPTTIWADRKRPSLCSPRDLQESLLAKTAHRIFLRSASVWQQVVVRGERREKATNGLPNSSLETEGTVILRLSASAGKALEQSLDEAGDKNVLAVLVPPAPEANARMVWKPGAKQILVITDLSLKPQRLAGNNIVLLRSDSMKGVVKIEDGFSALFSASQWKVFRRALAEGQPYFSSADGDGLDFELRWSNDTSDESEAPSLNNELPPGASYKTAPPAVNLAAKQKLERAMRLTQGKRDLEAILRGTVVCGPFLWEQIRSTPGIEKVGLASTIAIPGSSGNGPKIIQTLEGRTFRSTAEVSALQRALHATFTFDTEFTVRKARSQELALFWAMVPFDLQEPLFVVESKHHRLIAAFNSDDGSLMWLDDLENLTFDHGRVVKGRD
jgi:hypothetical protein